MYTYRLDILASDPLRYPASYAHVVAYVRAANHELATYAARFGVAFAPTGRASMVALGNVPADATVMPRCEVRRCHVARKGFERPHGEVVVSDRHETACPIP